MENVVSKRCQHPSCNTHPSYGEPGTQVATMCAAHGKELGFEDVINKRCQHPGCKTQSTHGEPGTKIATRCALHGKRLGFEDVANSRCDHPGCKTRACFGFSSAGGKASKCSAHMEDGMVDIHNVSKLCRHPGCVIRANFGAPGTKTATRCAKHAEFGMVNVLARRCEYPGCSTQPSYGSPAKGERTRHCAAQRTSCLVRSEGTGSEMRTRPLRGLPWASKNVAQLLKTY